MLANDRGMTVVEMVLASAVLLIVTIGAVGGIGFAFETISDNGKRAQAAEIASRRIEQIRTLPFDSVGTRYPSGGYGNPPGSILTSETIDGFDVGTSIAWVFDGMRVSSKLVKVTVVWKGLTSAERSVKMQTRVYGKSSLINIGTLEVLVQDWDSAAAIESAAVTVTFVPDGSEVSGTTDSDGRLLLGALSPGEWDATASRTGYLAPAPGTVSRATVPADGYTQTTVRLQRPSSMTFTVQDSNGQPLSDVTVLLTGPYAYSHSHVTNSSGQTTFNDLYVGQYSYTATRSGYAGGDGSATISQGNQDVAVGVSLAPGGDVVVWCKDENGVDVSEPSVSIVGPAPSTDPVTGSPFTGGTNGQLVVNGLAAGTYTVTASKTGYSDATGSVEVTGGASATLNLVLARNPFGSLLLTIRRSNGNPRVNYRVRVTGPNGFDQNNLRTDSNGQILLTDLQPGNYRIYAPYYSGSYTTAVVSSGQMTEMTLIR